MAADIGIYRWHDTGGDGDGVLALAPPLEVSAPRARLLILVTRTRVGSGVGVRVTQRWWSGWAARLATPAALAYGTVFPLVQVGLVAEYPPGDGDTRWALLATACYLPLHLHHVYFAVHGARAPGGPWTLAALAAVVAASVPAAGSNWLPVFAVVVVSAMFVLPWPWSIVVAAGVTLAQAPLALALDSPIPGATSYYVFAVWWRASALFVPLWLLGSIRRLEAARRSLAEEAVVRERLRIDQEVRRTVGAALGSIAARGERAVATSTGPALPVPVQPGGADGALAAEVRALADGSRRALAEARQLISGYQRPSLADELETATTLLAAAGIDTRVEIPREGLPPHAESDARAALRTATTGLLQNDAAGSHVIVLSTVDGRVRLDIRTDHEGRAP